jgi:signal transduction histidine kinase
MKSDRSGLIMIVASLAAIGLIFALIQAQQAKRHQEKVGAAGVAVTRTLAGFELAELVPPPGRPTPVSLLANLGDGFAYGAVTSLAGAPLFETAAAGSIVPAAPVPPTDPASWFGERMLAAPVGGRAIREFFGPVLKAGELAGFVRVGFYESADSTLAGANVTYVALLALPVFLLSVLSYGIARREVRPFARLSARIEEFGRAHGLALEGGGSRLGLHEYAERLDQFVQRVQAKVQEIDRQRLTAQSASQLLVYRQEKASAVLDALPDGVLVFDQSQVATYANPKIEPLLGVNRPEIIGEPPHKWCDNPELLALIAGVRSHRAIVGARTIDYTPAGQPGRRISASTYPLFSPRDPAMLLGTLVLFRDVSEEHRAREAGAEFVAQVSHELKTPLANVAAYSELLMDHGMLDETERVNAVNVIHDETERATALITNLLNLSKLEAGTLPMNRQRVQMADVLYDAADSMGKAAQTRNIGIDVLVAPDLGSARLDKTLFRVALDNLISNAIKYSDPGSRVTLSAEKVGDLEMKIVVRDRGIGIPAADLDKIFHKYYRSSEKALAERPGHGLGLYLAKQIIEMHHGSISVASELGKGTEFTLQFGAQTQRLDESDT